MTCIHTLRQAALWSLLWTCVASAQPFAYIAHQGDHGVTVIDNATHFVSGVVSLGDADHSGGGAVSPDGRRFYTGSQKEGEESGYVSVIDTATHSITDVVAVGRRPTGVAVSPDGRVVYVTNLESHDVSVIETATNTVTATIPVGRFPWGAEATPDGQHVYVTNLGCPDDVSVIETATNTGTVTIPVGDCGIGTSGTLYGIAATPDSRYVYIVRWAKNRVSVIDTTTNTIVGSISVGDDPIGIAISPNGRRAYVTNIGSDDVSVVNTRTNTVVANISVGNFPVGVSVTPDSQRVYVVNALSDNVSVIDAATNTVVDTVAVGDAPWALGSFIGPPGIQGPTCANDTRLCLNDERFTVEVAWANAKGETGMGRPVDFSTTDSGLFWFFSPRNWEMMVKVLDGCGINGHYWVFAAATTNVEYTLTVRDRKTGETQEYFNPLGVSSAAVTDTGAFAGCP
jgi:YVTN family beta-propeller protein